MSLPALTSRKAEAAHPRGLRAARPRGRRVPRGLPFIVPYLPFLIAFGIAPMLYALDLAVTNDNGGVTGFHNFVRTFKDYRFVPAFERVQLIRVWSGIEGYIADGQPIIGASATTAGLHYAFGFNGEGFAISPGVGEVMAELLATGATTTPIEAFSIARFRE